MPKNRLELVKRNAKVSQVRTAHLGALFGEKRRELGYSEELVAGYLEGTSVARLRQYEAGLVSIPLLHIYALANCLNVSPGHILKLVHES